jgi:hypothetical protein
MALLQPVNDLPLLAAASAAPRIRRCTFRRLSRVASSPEAGYEVSCLYPDRRVPLPLGGMESSLEICGPCVASHIFRPDED